MKSYMQTAFIVIFFGLIGIPLVMVELQRGRIVETENRIAAPMAELFEENGSFNEHFSEDFGEWFNDNIGYRSFMVNAYSRIQYYLFGNIVVNSNLYPGPHGELNYATEDMIRDYQHENLYSEKYLQKAAAGMQSLSDYAKAQGAQFYYFQCWDKHSVYPEYFPESVVQSPSESKTDGIVRALEQYSDVNVISPKQELIFEKAVNPTYSVWGDPAHWNDRGAYIGYRKLMETINEHLENRYRVLREEDYIITTPDQGFTLPGGIHLTEHIEAFRIKDPGAIPVLKWDPGRRETSVAADNPESAEETGTTKNISSPVSWKQRVLINDTVDNDMRLLVIGDSYFNTYIVDDLAESFHETIFIRNEAVSDFKKVADRYKADIIVLEAAERVDITKLMFR